eukprot:6183953-Pleurochrysis_carterae.AAC.2
MLLTDPSALVLSQPPPLSVTHTHTHTHSPSLSLSLIRSSSRILTRTHTHTHTGTPPHSDTLSLARLLCRAGAAPVVAPFPRASLVPALQPGQGSPPGGGGVGHHAPMRHRLWLGGGAAVPLAQRR